MKVALKIWRFDPATGERALRDYEVDAPEWATLLDVLDMVKDQVDGTLSYRKSCRMMICGSCGMRMDGAAVLACKTRMYDDRRGRPRAGHLGRWATCRSSRTSSSTWARSGRRSARSSRTSSPATTRSRREGVHRLAAADGRDPQGDRSASTAAAASRSATRWRPTPSSSARRRSRRACASSATRATARKVERLEAYNDEHGIWDCTRCYFCQRALPEGRRSARRDREARRGVDQGGHRPRHGREAREVVRARRRRRPAGCARRSSCRRRRASSPRSSRPRSRCGSPSTARCRRRCRRTWRRT